MKCLQEKDFLTFIKKKVTTKKIENKKIWIGILFIEEIWIFNHNQQLLLKKQIFQRLNEKNIQFYSTFFGGGFVVLFETNLNSSNQMEELNKEIKDIFDVFNKPFNLKVYIKNNNKNEVVSDKFFIEPKLGVSDSNFQGEYDSLSLNKWVSKSRYALQKTQVNSENYFVFNVADTDEKINQFALKSKVKEALINKDFSIVYQPKIDLRTNTCIGAECLSRLKNDSVNISPYLFIPILEQNNWMKDFDYCILEILKQDIKNWTSNKKPPIRVSLNLSAVQIDSDEKLHNFEKILEQLASNKNLLLDFEITEGTLMEDFNRTQEIIKKMKSYGATCSIDDFGKGFSSLSYLKNLPVNSLKIDKIFIDDLVESPETQIIVKSIIDMAHNLNLIVLAEGVENEEQLNILKEMNCDQAQGYYFGKPMNFLDFKKWFEGF